jgi:pilus assembly protein CpaC
MLEVRFLEASRDAGRQLGVSWFGANNAGTHGVRTGLGSVGVNGTTSNTPSGIPIFATADSLVGTGLSGPFGTFVARALTTNNTQLDVVLTALEEKGLVRRLAEPNLMALSGDQASFLAGGEFPVPVSSTTLGGVPTIAIEFKKFGVQLNFKPTVLSRGTINLKVDPEVSELDYTNAVTLSGTQIPSLTKRTASTTVELRDGQSFAIAGLLSSTNTRDVSQLPWIGSVPVLGALFRSAAYQQKETDLVIIVTPRLVSPAVPGQRLATPLDNRLPSNDVDFFLNGQPEVKKRYSDYVASGGGLTGPYGHIIAVEPPMPPVPERSARLTVHK